MLKIQQLVNFITIVVKEHIAVCTVYSSETEWHIIRVHMYHYNSFLCISYFLLVLLPCLGNMI